MVETPGLTGRVDELVTTSGTSREDFARAVGLDTARLSAVLGGAGRFSSRDLALIADAHDVTVDWLLTGEPSVLMRGVHLPAGSARTLVERADELADLRGSAARLGRPQRWRPVEVDPSISALAEQGKVLAETVLRQVRAAGRDVADPDLPALVEDVFGVDVAVHDAGPGIDGLVVCSPGARLLLVAATADAARQRFTLAHGLGRLLAGDDPDVLHLDVDVHDVGDDPAEMRADAFARRFLAAEGAPARGTDEFCDAVGQALAPRAARLLQRDLHRAYEVGETTLRPVARLLGVEPDQLRETMGHAW